jgi:hypothetical protein
MITTRKKGVLFMRWEENPKHAAHLGQLQDIGLSCESKEQRECLQQR